MAGMIAPSAGDVGLVITAYEHRAKPGQVKVESSADLTPPLYRELRSQPQ
jgi:hypothetical protein